MLEDVLKEYGGQEVSAMEVYTDIFRLGEGVIQSSGSSRDHRPNPIGYWKNGNQRTGHFRVMLEDTFEESLKEMQDADFSLMNGITYYGRRRDQARSSKMYAMIFDLDGVTDVTLNRFVHGAKSEFEIYPLPNYIILSGTGVHLYYVFEEPISLYPYMKTQLKELKYALTDKMWNGYTSIEKSKQFQGIYQAFRVIGGATKIKGVRVRAFRMNSHPYTLEQLGRYIPEEHRVDEKKLYKESRMSLADAKEKYPEWYQQTVLGGQKKDGHWVCKRDLYEWWIRKIREDASYGHRYYDIMCLVIYAVKSGVPLAEVKKDAYDLVPFLNGINPDQPFTRSDVKSALECYDEGYYRYPIDDIIRKSGIQIKKNKRNYQKQKWHLEDCRSKKANMIRRGQKFKNPEGRPSAETLVIEWQLDHPDGRKADCIRDTGLSKPTVYKHWKSPDQLADLLPKVTVDRSVRSKEDQERVLKEFYDRMEKELAERQQ